MSRLLIICPYFPPTAASGAHRMLGFARHLPKFGWDVSVVTCAPVWWEPRDELLAAQVPENVSVTFVPFPKGRWAAAVHRALKQTGVGDNYLLWSRSARRVCGRIVDAERPDAIFTSGPPHSVHLLGLKLKRRFGLPWIADFRDPWVSQEIPHRGRQRIARRWEAAVMRQADVIVANAPRAHAVLQRSYPASAMRIVCVTNGYDPESVPRRSPRARSSRVEVLHAGELYAGRDPRPMLDALSELCASDPSTWHVTFLGRCKWSGLDLAQEICRRGCSDSVSIVEHAPYNVTKQRMVDADILLLLDAAGRRSGVPAKLYEYVGCQRPVLALAEPESDTAWVLRTSGVPHRIVSPLDMPGIRQALLELVSIVRSEEEPIGNMPCAMAFTREESARQLTEALDRLTGRSTKLSPAACLA